MSDPISANRSMFNPADVGAMRQQGGIQPGMQIKDLLAQFGLTPEDPVEKLAQVMKSQVQNASPIGKMENMAGQPAPSGAGLGGEPSLGSPPRPPMDRLMNGMR